MRRIGLVGCVKEKADHQRPARDLYVSPLFRLRRRYVERSCGDDWWILSAKHGLVHPDDPLEPYDVTLKDLDMAARRRWSRHVVSAIAERINPVEGETFEIHAGAEYREYGLVAGLQHQGCKVANPTKGMRLGEQLRFYKKASEEP